MIPKFAHRLPQKATNFGIAARVAIRLISADNRRPRPGFHTRDGQKAQLSPRRSEEETDEPDGPPEPSSRQPGPDRRHLERRQLARQAGAPDARLSGPRPSRGRRGPAAALSAPRLCRRGAAAEGIARPRRRGPRLRAARRRLRRELRRFHRQYHPRHLPRAVADGRGADLRQQRAGGEDGPHGGAIRQAAQRRYRDGGRGHAAELSRRHHQWPGLHGRGPGAGPGADGDRLLPVGRHAQPAARLRHRRLCRSAFGPSLEPRLRRAQPARRPLPGPRDAHRRDAALHERLRHDRRNRAANPRDGFLHQPRGAAAAL